MPPTALTACSFVRSDTISSNRGIHSPNTVSAPDNKADGEEASQQKSAELMYVRCANCGAWLGVKPGRINSISHGLCPPCYAKEIKKLDDCLRDEE